MEVPAWSQWIQMKRLVWLLVLERWVVGKQKANRGVKEHEHVCVQNEREKRWLDERCVKPWVSEGLAGWKV